MAASSLLRARSQGGVTNQPRLAAWLKPSAIARAIRASLRPLNLKPRLRLSVIRVYQRLGKQRSERDIQEIAW